MKIYQCFEISIELNTFWYKYISPSSKENFREYLRAATNVITKNIYNYYDNTFNSITNLRKKENIVVLSINKESCTVILNKSDYVNKVNKMIDEGIATRTMLKQVILQVQI